MPKKTEMESFTGEYAMSAADNALSSKHFQYAITSADKSFAEAAVNEDQFRKKMLDEPLEKMQ